MHDKPGPKPPNTKCRKVPALRTKPLERERETERPKASNPNILEPQALQIEALQNPENL